MTDMTLAALLTVGSLAIVVSIACEVIIGALAWDAPTQGRFGPLLACVLGMVIAVVAAFATGTDLAQAVLTGFVAGAAAMGVHGLATSNDVVKGW